MSSFGFSNRYYTWTSGRSRVSRSCKKIKKNKGQDVNQIPDTSSCSERVARTRAFTYFGGEPGQRSRYLSQKGLRQVRWKLGHVAQLTIAIHRTGDSLFSVYCLRNLKTRSNKCSKRLKALKILPPWPHSDPRRTNEKWKQKIISAHVHICEKLH